MLVSLTVEGNSAKEKRLTKSFVNPIVHSESERHQMSETSDSEKGKWRFSHVSPYTENVCEIFTDDKGKVHYRWLYPDGKMEYICACHRFLNK